MKKHWIVKVIGTVLVGILAGVVFGFVIEGLWNSLMPALFHSPRLTYWQAIGLFLLSRILLGGFHHRGGFRRGPGGGRWKRHMWQRWERMTPEEREKFRAGMKGCGFAPNPEPQS